MKYKCIIFDCDGVLVNSEYIANRVLIEMTDLLGLKLTLEYVIENYEGKSLKTCFEDIEHKINKKLPDDFEENYRKSTFKAFKTELKPIDGIHDLLDMITVPYGVASNGPLEKMELNLTTTLLIDYFKGNIFSAYEIGSWKPNPEIYLYAAEKMGFKVNEIAVIEDSQTGIQAAISGGFDTYRFVGGQKGNVTETKGVKTFFGMNELYELLSKT